MRNRIAVCALLLGGALTLAACGATQNGHPIAGGSAAGSSTPAGTASATVSPPSTPTSSAPAFTPVPVHVSLNLGDGAQVGIGMPIIAEFNHVISNGAAFAKATTVTVNGEPAVGAWYFEASDPASGHVMEAHYRPEKYWPGHAQIKLDLPIKGLSGGTVPGHHDQQWTFNDDLTLSFETGPANVLTVDDQANAAGQHTLKVVSDGKTWGTFPVSLGASDTPTRRGVKVIMEKLPTVCMHDIAGTYYECGIKDDQRLTYDGEYLHAAPWNVGHINSGVDSSNGCTNLLPSDAVKLFNFLEVGDVVAYPNAQGPKMRLGDGYGDWNVSWALWQTGGAVPTS